MGTSALCDTLIGSRYNKESIKAALDKLDLENTFYHINNKELLDIIY